MIPINDKLLSLKKPRLQIWLLSISKKLSTVNGLSGGTFPHIFKKIGIWMAVIIVLAMIVMKVTLGAQIAFIKPYPKVLFMIALWLVAMSKDKIEDEGIVDCRMRSFRFAYSFMLVSLIWNIIYVSIDKDVSFMTLDTIIFTFQFVYLFAFALVKYLNNKV